MNFKALVLVAATIATSAAFAATTELGDLGVDITASTDFTDTANAVTTAVGDVLSAGETTIAENVAIIGQNGAVGHVAFIDQTDDGTGGNFAAIIQTSQTNASVGYIGQTGSLNVAVINQHD